MSLIKTGTDGTICLFSMKNKYKTIVFVILMSLSITAPAFCFMGDVEDISGGKYFSAVKEVIGDAERSIKAVMFIVELPQSRGNTKVQQLVDELVKAKGRGVDVEVILDANVNFVNRRHKSEWQEEMRSMRAYKQLKEAGVSVYYDDLTTYTHAKALVVDEKNVVIGSTNWTQSSLTRNIETNVLIESEELARSILSYFKSIKVDRNIDLSLTISEGSMPIPYQLMCEAKLAPKMMKKHAERAILGTQYLIPR